MAARLSTPRYCIQSRRFPRVDGWLLWDLSLSLIGNIAVTGYNKITDQTYIEVYTTVDDSDSRNKPNIFYSTKFEKYVSADGWSFDGRRVSFINNDDENTILTSIGDKLEVIDLIDDLVLRSRRIKVEYYRNICNDINCLSVREREIFIGFRESNKITVYDVIDLNEIKTIILQGIQHSHFPSDVAVISGRIFVCEIVLIEDSDQRVLICEDKNGKMLSALTKPTDTAQWYVMSLAVNKTLNVIAVVWSQKFDNARKGMDVIAFSSLLNYTYCRFLFLEVEYGVDRIRIFDRGDMMVTANWRTGDVKVFGMAELFSFGQLKTILQRLLHEEDCLRLADLFALPESLRDTILNSDKPAECLFRALEWKGVIQPSNVDRLAEVFAELGIKSACSYLVDFYQKTRLQATLYGRFLATLSAHLSTSSIADLCEYLKISNEKEKSITSSPDPGLSLLLVLDEIGIINPLRVEALKQLFNEFELVQAEAKINEYQSTIGEGNQLQQQTTLTEEEFKELFIKCLQKRIKGWYETTSPVPWKRSCRWKCTDLFVGSGLILTDSKAERSLTDIDEECKLQYNQILNHKKLKSETRIILEGEPGSGKTIMSSQLAYDWSQGKISEVDVLIFLPLKLVNNITLLEAVKELYCFGYDNISVHDIESFLKKEDLKSCLVLDGFEEYSSKRMKTAGEPSEVVEVMEKSKYPNCKVILTSRSDYAKNLPACPMLRIGRFGENERNTYIEKVFADNEEKQKDIKRAIENTPFVLDLCRVPLLFVFAVHNIESIIRLQESQLDRVAPFMENMVKALCILPDPSSEGNVSNSEGVSDESLLEEFAYNGLCRGQQVLSWQKYVLEASISNLKQFLNSGILVVEEGIARGKLRIIPDEKTQDNFSQKKKEEKQTEIEATGANQMNQTADVGTGTMSSSFHQVNYLREGSPKNVTTIKSVSSADETKHSNSRKRFWKRFKPEIFTKKSVLHSEETKTKTGFNLRANNRPSYAQADRDPLTKDNAVKSTHKLDSKQLQPALESESELSEKTSSGFTAKDFPLEVKFLHKVIQEWFASKHFSSMLWKSLKNNSFQAFLYNVLPQINPIDLHYILRFTSYLCPPSCYLIMDYLCQSYLTVNGNISEYIMNIACLCFAEFRQENIPHTITQGKGVTNESMNFVVAKMCREVMIVRSDDSRISQQSKIALLEHAEKNGILIREVHLVDVVKEVDGSSTKLTSGVRFDSFNMIEILEMSRWDQHLEEKDYQSIVKLVLCSHSIKKARLHFPSQPPDIEKEALGDLVIYDKTVEWIIGPKLIQTLNMETFKWEIIVKTTDDNNPPSKQIGETHVVGQVLYNLEAEDPEDLTINVGDIITNLTFVYFGWMEGELNGNRGLFPSHYVKVITLNPSIPAAKTRASNSQMVSGDVKSDENASKKTKLWAKVIASYESQDDDELSLEVKQYIEVTNNSTQWWWEGILKGKRGMFPSNYVILLSESEETEQHDNDAPVKAQVMYDYEAVDLDELTINVGDIITGISVLGEGWWKGVVNGKRGMFPSKCVRACTDVQVKYNYDAVLPDELTIEVGDIITDISVITDGWWEGILNGKRGMFPSNFVEVCTDTSESSTQAEVVLAKVVLNHTPQSDDELFLVKDDIIEITSQLEPLWWEGIMNGYQGRFPAYCVALIQKDGEGRRQQDYASPDDQREAILSAETTVSNDGGVLEIAGTDVKLIIPPDALGAKNTMSPIRMRIIPSGSHDVAPTSFSCNSSVIVELLPNNLRFCRPVELTLPHCLQLRKDVEYKVRIFMSHHDGSAEPRWEEVADHNYILNDRACTLWLNSFCWTKYEIDDEIVEAKRITVFTAASPICVPDDIAVIEVGYHLDLPGAGEKILRLNPSLIVGQCRPYLFLREGKHPLQVSLHKILPSTWNYSTPDENPKEIPFRSVASSIEYSCLFILQQDTKSCDIPTCVFKASQNQNDIELFIRPKAVQTLASSSTAAEVHFQENVTNRDKETTNQSEQYLGVQKPNQEVSSLQVLHSPSSNPETDKEPLVCSATKGEEISVSKSETTADQNLGPRFHSSQTQLKHQVEENPHQLLQYRGQQPGVNNLSIKHYDYSQHVHMVPIPSSAFGGLYGPHEPPWYGESGEAGGPSINYSILVSIAKKLDPPDPLHNDWKMLAGQLGFTIEDITLFERFKSPTCEVIPCAFQRGKLESLEQLKSILTRINRADAAKCISA